MPFILRIPNLLALAFYLFACYKILQTVSSVYLRMAGFVLLCTNPFLMEFFSLSRGYGISLACVMGALWLLQLWHSSNSLKYIYYGIGLAILAAWSNFIYIYFFCIYILIPLVYYFYKKEYKTLFIIATVSFLLCFPVAAVILLLQLNGGLWLGTGYGFWQSTVSSLVKGTFYTKIGLYSEMLVHGLIWLAAIFFMALFILRKNYFFKADSFKFFAASIYFLFGIILITYLLHYSIGVHFLYDRAGLILIPFFFLSLIFSVDFLLSQKDILKSLAVLFFSVFLCINVYSFSTNFSLTKTFSFIYQHDVEDAINVVAERRTSDFPENKKINLGCSYVMANSLNFYRLYNDYNWLQWVSYGIINPEQKGDYAFYSAIEPLCPHHYLYIYSSDLALVESMYRVEVLKTYPVSATLLVKVIE